jgi:hypothetical protein
MTMDYSKVLLARNRTKRRCNVYYYEAMGNIARANGFTASEFAFGCMAMAMIAMRCKMDFLTERDRLILNKIRMCLTYLK